MNNEICPECSGNQRASSVIATFSELIFEKWKHKVDIVIDGGYGNNIPSTIVDLSQNEIIVLREGKGSIEDL